MNSKYRYGTTAVVHITVNADHRCMKTLITAGSDVNPETLSLEDPGGRRRRAPPQQAPFLLFLRTFLLKSVCIGGWRSPQWVSAPPPKGNPGSATDYVGSILGILLALVS